MSNSLAQTAAGVLVVQSVIDGIFTIGKAGDPDTAMAIALTQGMYLGIHQPEVAAVLAESVSATIGNPRAKVGQGDTANIVAAMYNTALAEAERAIAANPVLASEAEAELAGR